MIKPAVKIGTSRQVVIPKQIHDGLKLSAGDYLTVETKGHQVIFTPQSLIDKGIAEGLEDIRQGRVRSFDDVEDMIKHLKRAVKTRRQQKSGRRS